MKDLLPDFLIQGETARLFPVLSTTSKEGRTTSIVLACLSKVDEFGASLLSTLGQRVGTRSKIDTYTEVVFKNRLTGTKDRPDGLIVLNSGRKEWRALVEAKIANSELNLEQIEKYRQLAKDNNLDCVITISNQFAPTPSQHPVDGVSKSRSKIPVYHWSWMHILTEADLLLNQDNVSDNDQKLLLNELRRFLSHESAGVKGFDRMPKAWSDLNKLISSGGIVPKRSGDALEVVQAWHQETRDLSLILSRMTEASVSEKLSRNHKNNLADREKDALSKLCETQELNASLEIPDAAATVDINANIPRRTIEVGMTLRAPEDKVSTKARLNWLLRQIKTEKTEDLFVRLLWPGSAPPTQHLYSELKEDIALAEIGMEGKSPHSFSVFYSKRLGGRFTQQTNFIVDLEEIVPSFYANVGVLLNAWKKPPPTIKKERSSAEDVAVDAISDDAGQYKL